MDETSPKTETAEEKKAKVIFRVRSGNLTAQEGAALLQLSRKSYYEWEARGLAGMLSALTEKPPGRPKHEEDPEKEAMRKKIAELEEELVVAKKTLHVRRLLEAWDKQKAKEAGKKTPRKKS
jgi:hypothetical protein